MNDEYEIETPGDCVMVWARNWKGGYGLVAEFNRAMTLNEIAQEVYELIAYNGNKVCFKDE